MSIAQTAKTNHRKNQVAVVCVWQFSIILRMSLSANAIVFCIIVGCVTVLTERLIKHYFP